jgi:hypothetical protein
MSLRTKVEVLMAMTLDLLAQAEAQRRAIARARAHLDEFRSRHAVDDESLGGHELPEDVALLTAEVDALLDSLSFQHEALVEMKRNLQQIRR